MNFRHSYLAAALSTVACFGLCAAELETKPDDAYFAKFNPVKAPMTSGLALKKGDRLAIIGDSITEQKMYSRMMETYLTVCVPELEVSVRQYGWSGEQAPGFLARMTNDCLQFHPTIATTCYGMNDHGYRTYEPAIGERYRKYTTAILDSFQQAGTRVIQGSPGCVGKVPTWTKSDAYNLEQLNLNLCELRNIGIDVAQTRHIPFADVFWPMLTAQVTANQKYGANFAVAGKDGVHPGWAGHTLMAYAFLKALGLDGNLGVIEVDLAKSGAATATAGHKVTGSKSLPQGASVTITSTRYPFCRPPGDVSKDDTINAGMALVPFNQDLNRLVLKVNTGKPGNYKVTWGKTSKSYSSEELAKGVNLAADFISNPFSAAFAKVDEAVAAKQNYETWQIKSLFHGREGATDLKLTTELTEKTRAPLVAAMKKAFVPVTHTIEIAAE